MTALQQRISQLMWNSLITGLLAGGLLLVGWSFVEGGDAETARQRVLQARGEPAVAEVTASALEGKAVVVTLRYTTREGRVVTLPGQDLSGPDDVGRRLAVWYDPEDPSVYSTDVRADGFGFDTAVGQVVLVAGAAAGAVAVALFVTAVVVEARHGRS